MSVLGIGGRRFAAGLYWLERGNAASVARNARAFRRPWHVQWGGQTGYAADDGEPQGCPSLAASLQAHIGTPSWMALAEADDGRVALVKARDGSILADGDEVFADKAPALKAFERVRDSGWSLHATAGLVDGEVGEIDPASLVDDPAMRLVAVPLSWVRLPKAGRFLVLAAVVAGAALAWTQREALWHLVAGPEPVAEAEQVPVDPPVTVALDAAALIAGCRQALTDHPPYMPGWRTERVSCEGRFSDPALTATRPELDGRAVLIARWRLDTGRPAPLHRRIAEAHLSHWYAAQVTGSAAWAVVPLAPVLRLYDAPAPSLLEFRDAVDRRFGARGTRIEYPGQADGIEVRIAFRRPLAALAAAVAAVSGLELVRLARIAGEWRLEGRRVSPVSMPRARFDQMTRSTSQPAAHPTAGPAANPRPQSSTQPARPTATGRQDHG